MSEKNKMRSAENSASWIMCYGPGTRIPNLDVVIITAILKTTAVKTGCSALGPPKALEQLLTFQVFSVTVSTPTCFFLLQSEAVSLCQRQITSEANFSVLQTPRGTRTFTGPRLLHAN